MTPCGDTPWPRVSLLYPSASDRWWLRRPLLPCRAAGPREAVGNIVVSGLLESNTLALAESMPKMGEAWKACVPPTAAQPGQMRYEASPRGESCGKAPLG